MALQQPPLITLVDYLGFRLMASLAMPLSHSTLRHGSDDGGRSMLGAADVSEDTQQRLQLLCKRVNLASHSVAGSSTAGLAWDVELHDMAQPGQTAALVAVDTARLLPPQCPLPSNEPGAALRCSYLYRLLRPELVLSHDQPLCSDAFNGLFGTTAPRAEVVAAHNAVRRCVNTRLLGFIVPAFVKWADARVARPRGTAVPPPNWPAEAHEDDADGVVTAAGEELDFPFMESCRESGPLEGDALVAALHRYSELLACVCVCVCRHAG